MNLRVTHGAGLILRRLIVYGPAWTTGCQLARESVALQTKHVHRHHVEQLWIGGAVGRVATGAALGLHRHMFVDKGTLLIDMALVANGVAAREAPQLPDSSRTMRVVAVHALHQTLVDTVVIWFGEICLGRGVASVTQLGLFLDEEELFFFSVMGRVAIEASDIATGVSGLGEVRLFMGFAVTG